MSRKSKPNCPDCVSSVSRRTFLQASAGVAAVGVVAPMGGWHAFGAPKPDSAAETAVGKLYQSLSDEQRKSVCLSFDDPLRHRISANWHVTKPKIGDGFFSKDQQAIITDVVRNITSEDGYGRFDQQMKDDSGGIGDYSVAIFGTPGSGKFQFELTGRHLTLRADGDSVDKAAFGGPIVYGHGQGNPKNNLFHYQTKQVNEVFKALDAKQAEKALLDRAPAESQVKIQGDGGKFPGIAVADMSADQKKLVEATLKTLLAPYRSEDVEEAMAILQAAGGVDKLHFSFYQQGDLDDDNVWDVWRVEGPAMAWNFRGAPHVHAYINIGSAAG